MAVPRCCLAMVFHTLIVALSMPIGRKRWHNGHGSRDLTLTCPAGVQEHFMAQVEGRVAASTTYARAFVHQYVAAQISKARKNIETYAEQYSHTMREALNTHKEGKC